MPTHRHLLSLQTHSIVRRIPGGEVRQVESECRNDECANAFILVDNHIFRGDFEGCAEWRQLLLFVVILYCEHIPTWISLSGDLAFSHQDGIYGFKFPKRFSELSQAMTSLYSLYLLY
jgi:hypothetical protein